MWLKENMKLLKFSSSSCAPCKALSKTIEGMKVPFPVQEISVDSDVESAMKYKVRSVPTLILVDHQDSVVSVKTGSLSADVLQQWFASFDESNS